MVIFEVIRKCKDQCDLFVLSCLFFKTGWSWTHYVAQAVLKLTNIWLPQLPEYWNHGHLLLFLAVLWLCCCYHNFFSCLFKTGGYRAFDKHIFLNQACLPEEPRVPHIWKSQCSAFIQSWLQSFFLLYRTPSLTNPDVSSRLCSCSQLPPCLHLLNELRRACWRILSLIASFYEFMTFPSCEACFLNSLGPALIFIASVPYLKAVFALVDIPWFCPYSKWDSQVGIWEIQYSCNWFLGSFLIFSSVHCTETPDLPKLYRAKWRSVKFISI